MVSSGGHHRTIQKVNSVLMKSLLEKLAKQLQTKHQELSDEAKGIHRLCLNYLRDERSQPASKDSKSSPKIGFFAMVKNLSTKENGLYMG